jgi:hypothetical protein
MYQRKAAEILKTLDETASQIEKLAKEGYINPKIASQVVSRIDSFSDKYQASVFGVDGLKAHQAKVLKRDSDEPYMDTFNNPQKVIKSDPDEPYMHVAPGGYSGKDIPTFDNDVSSSVSERDEYDVRDLSEWSDKTKKQPSWSKGSKGKSTAQG